MAQIIVGLDIGSRSVRLARLKVGFKSVELESLMTWRIDEAPLGAVAEAIKGADQVYAAVPGDQITIRQLEFPRAAAKRLEQILPIELDGEIPFDISEMVIGSRVTGQTSERLQVLVVAAKKEKVEAQLTELSEVGVKPRELAPGPIVLAELGKLAFSEETVAVVDVGHTRTDIAIVEHGDFQRARTSSFGGEDVSHGLAKAFGVPTSTAEEWKLTARYLVMGDLDALSGEQRQAAEAVRVAVDRLVRELRQTFAAHTLANGESISRVVLCGAASRLRGLDEYLSSELGIPADFFTAPESLGGAAQHDVVSGATSIAIALSGRHPKNERINLRQGELAFEGEVKVGRGLMLYGLAAVFLIMLAWGFSAFARQVSLERQSEAQYAELAAASQRLLGSKIDSFAQLRSLMTKAAENQGSASSIPELDAFDVVEEISKRIPAKINHEIDTLDIRSGRIQLKGRVDQPRDADEIQKALSQWEACFVKVQAPHTIKAVKRLQYTMDIETRCP